MRVVIAKMSHETNTFSPVKTELSRFFPGRSSPLEGEEAIKTYRGTASVLGGFIEICDEIGAEIILPIAVDAEPSDAVENDAFEFICNKIVTAIAKGCDAIMLCLHGAMVTKTYEDGEGELLRRIREVAPKVPMAIALDMHGNIYPSMVERADIVAGFQTYPHIDMDTTAKRAGKGLIKMMKQNATLTMVWGNVPMLPHVMRQSSEDFPNSLLQARAQEMEKAGALAVSVFTGFPHADISQAGLSVVVVTDNDKALAEKYRDELLQLAWSNREAFVYKVESLKISVAKAKELGNSQGDDPVILLDHYDNTASGGTMDTTEVLAEILEQGLEDVAVFGFYDPIAVKQMVEAGLGKEVTVFLGGKIKMPSLPKQSQPLKITGRVKVISEGNFPTTVAMGRGLIQSMGTAVVLTTGKVDIVVVSNHIEPYDPGCFTCLGIEPSKRKFIMLKSRVHFRVGFKKMAKAIVECGGNGVCTSDYSILKFKNVRRPIYPLDDMKGYTI